MARQAAEKRGVAAQRLGRPGHLGKGQQPREGEIFHVALRAVLVDEGDFLQRRAVDELVGPHAALHAHDGRRGRIVVHLDAVGLFERYGRHPRGVLHLARRGSFGKVEVEVRAGGEHGLVPRARGLDGVGHVVPDEGRDGRLHPAALYDFLPAQHGAPAAGRHAGHDVRQPALQLRGFRQAFALHDGAAARALLPARIDRLVAPDADDGRGEEGAHLVEHVFEKPEGALLAHAQQVAADEVLHGHLVLLARTAQLGVGHDGRQDVGGKLQLGHNLHAAHAGVGDELAHVVLRIIAAQAVFVGPGPGAHLRQARVFLDFEAPARVVNHVQLQAVELVHGHHVDIFLHKLLVEEIARHVEHHAAPWPVGGIADAHAGSRPRHAATAHAVVHLGREELQERLHAVESPRGVGRLDAHAAALHRQAVALGGQRGAVGQREADVGPTRAGAQLKVPARRARERFLQIARLGGQRGVAGDGHVGAQPEAVGHSFHMERPRYDVDVLSADPSARQRQQSQPKPRAPQKGRGHNQKFKG